MERTKKRENDLKEIKLIYTSGTEKILKKGIIPTITPEDHEEATVGFEILNMSSYEMYMFVVAAIKLGKELGLLDEE